MRPSPLCGGLIVWDTQCDLAIDWQCIDLNVKALAVAMLPGNADAVPERLLAGLAHMKGNVRGFLLYLGFSRHSNLSFFVCKSLDHSSLERPKAGPPAGRVITNTDTRSGPAIDAPKGTGHGTAKSQGMDGMVFRRLHKEGEGHDAQEHAEKFRVRSGFG